MDQWVPIFSEAQLLTRSSGTLEQKLEQLIEFARSHPEYFDYPAYWLAVEAYDFRPDFLKLVNWVREGLDAYRPDGGLQFLKLDLGDCPDSFNLYRSGGQNLMSERKFNAIFSHNLLICDETDDCFEPEVADPYKLQYGDNRLSFCDHHISELENPILNWDHHDNNEDIENCACLLWLTLGSLALIEQLSDSDYCKAVLGTTARLYLLAGFESLFFPVCVVTPVGIQFEGPDSETLTT
jgi:hypothetical protein